MKKNTTPPDMSKEQAAELRQLRARLAKLGRNTTQDIARDTRGLAAIQRKKDHHATALLREMKRRQKEFAQSLAAEERLLRTGIHRHRAKTSVTQKECAAITKRIAVLEGRLGS